MKTIRTTLALILIISTILCVGFVPVQAAEEPIAGAFAYPGQDFYITDKYGNQYSSITWSSLDAAKNYYGRNFTYSECDQYYGGMYYNFCYYFSDNTCLFFYVGV